MDVEIIFRCLILVHITVRRVVTICYKKFLHNLVELELKNEWLRKVLTWSGWFCLRIVNCGMLWCD